MNYRSGNLLAITSIVAMLMVLIIADFCGLDQLSKFNQSRNLLKHTDDTLIALYQFSVNMRDAEVAHRSFLFTGSKEFLTSYDEAVAKLFKTSKPLYKLIEDDPPYRKFIVAINDSIEKKLAWQKSTINLRLRKDFKTLSQDILMTLASQQTDTFHMLTRQIRTAEYSLIDKCWEEENKAAKFSYFQVVLICTLAIIFQVIMSLVTIKFLHSQGKDESKEDEEAVPGRTVNLSKIILLKSFSKIAASAAVIVSSIIILGWLFHIPAVIMPLSGHSTMKINTALCIVAIGCFLLLPQKRWQWLKYAITTAIIGFSLLSISQWCGNYRLSIDEFFFKYLGGGPQASLMLGRIGLNTAICLFLIGASLLINLINKWLRPIADALTVFALIISFFALIGYLFGIQNFYTVTSFEGMALVTAAVFVILELGILCAEPQQGIMALIASNTSGGFVIRRLLPASILVPIVVGLLRFKAQQIFHFPWEFGLGLMVTSMVLLACSLVWVISDALARTDIERSKAQALFVKEKKFRDLLESAPDAMVIFNQQGTVVLTNSQLENIFGYRKEELIGLPVEMLIPDIFKLARAGNRQTFLANLITQSNEKGLELYAKHKDEVAFPVEISLSPLETEEGILVSSVIRDTTERKQLEQDLKKQKELFQIVLSNLSDGVMVADKEGKFLVINQAAQKMTGLINVDAPTDKWTEIFGVYLPDTVNPYPSKDLPLVRVLNGETVTDVELFLRNKFIPQGTWISVNGRPMEIQGAEVGVITFRDITARKEVERRVSEFYSMVSHELRSPLTSINGALSLMEGGRLGALPEKALHLSHIARMEAERLIRLINDILDVRKIEAGKLELKFEELSPVDIINSTVESMKAMAAESNIELLVEVTITDTIMCDRDRVIQILTNLISNAIKFSPVNSQIIVRAENRDSNFVRFSVADRGPGIAQQHMSKLFLLFQQIDSSDSRPKGGTGLGLAISKAIAEQHGGKIGVDTVVNVGSTFWFELPSKKLFLVKRN